MERRTTASATHLALVLAAIAALLLGAAPAASAAGAHASIIGGSPAAISSLPSLAFIEAQTSAQEGFDCTGTVVAPRVVLTAGHCVEDIESGRVTPASDYAVAIGVSDVGAATPENVFHVSRAVVYPSFSPSLLHNDAGLLVLTTPTSAPALAMATGADSGLLASGTELTIAGWGLTNPQQKGVDGILRSATTQVQSGSFCAGRVGRYYPFYSPGTQLCAIDPPSYSAGTCHGDSGGPAIATSGSTAVEVGIVSLGEAKCSTKLPDVFTRVDKISSWVSSWIAAVEGGGSTPVVKTPPAKIPKLTISRTHYFVDRGLREDFGRRYTAGSAKSAQCSRIKRARVRCAVSWSQGGNDYSGAITIFYVLGPESVLWDDRYVIHWVNHECWFHGSERSRCPVHTQSR